MSHMKGHRLYEMFTSDIVGFASRLWYCTALRIKNHDCADMNCYEFLYENGYNQIMANMGAIGSLQF